MIGLIFCDEHVAFQNRWSLCDILDTWSWPILQSAIALSDLQSMRQGRTDIGKHYPLDQSQDVAGALPMQIMAQEQSACTNERGYFGAILASSLPLPLFESEFLKTLRLEFLQLQSMHPVIF